MIPIQILESWVGRSIGMNLILQFFAGLDRITFTVFGWVMQAIFDIANTEIVTDNLYNDFETRVYVILGIFMLFKVTISLLTYLVNPDKINDKESGMGKMVTRTIIVICMLIGLPFLFNLLNRAQPILLEALPRIIIGKDMSVDTNSGEAISSTLGSQAAGVSDRISWHVFQLALNEGTVALMAKEDINTVAGATAVITEPDTDSSVYKYYYLPFIGSVIALVMTFLMVGLCIDVAIRSFKLVILRMIAPIPIISYIDPKSAKDGAFNGWVKALTSTWLDLFIRLGIIYFALFMIDEVILKWDVNLDTRNAVVVVFLIVGLMFFAKQAPKFIMDILGIKSKGEGFGFGKALTAAAIGAGAIGAGIASGRASYMADEATGKNHNLLRMAKNVGAGLFGAGSGVVTGVGAATSAKDHNTRAAMDALRKRNSAALANGAVGSTLFGRIGAGASDFFTGQTSADRDERYIKRQQEYSKSLGDIIGRVKDKTGTSLDTKGTISYNGTDLTAANYAKFASAGDAAMARGATSWTFEDGAGITRNINAADYAILKDELFKANQNDYYANSGYGDDDLVDLVAVANSKGSDIGATVPTSFGGSTGVKAAAGEATRNANARARSNGYSARVANRDASRKK